MTALTKDRLLSALPIEAWRAINYSPRYNLLYLTNQKAACSTLKLWLQRIEKGDPDFWLEHLHSESILPRPDRIGWDRLLALLAGEAVVFSFVRDPFARCVSAYHDKMVRQGRKFRPEVQTALGQTPDPARDVSFDEFLTAIEKTDEAALNPHWAPQYRNILHGIVDCGFVGRVESFDDDIRRLAEKAGVPIDDIPAVAVNANVRRGARQDDLAGHPERRRRIERIYAKDFELFGY